MKMGRRKKIGLDNDEFINPMIADLIPLYDSKYGQNLRFEDLLQYDISPYLVPECKNIFAEFIDDDFILRMKIDPIVKQVIDYLIRTHDVVFPTAGYPSTMEARDRWFFENIEGYKTKMLIMCSEKQLLNLDILGDDYEKNLIGGDYLGLLLTKPWNGWFNEKEYGIKRINHVVEMLKYL
jgi:5'(3')-deoxyribonucleotidase